MGLKNNEVEKGWYSGIDIFSHMLRRAVWWLKNKLRLMAGLLKDV